MQNSLVSLIRAEIIESRIDLNPKQSVIPYRESSSIANGRGRLRSQAEDASLSLSPEQTLEPAPTPEGIDRSAPLSVGEQCLLNGGEFDAHPSGVRPHRKPDFYRHSTPLECRGFCLAFRAR